MASAVRQSAVASQVCNSVQCTCLAGKHCSCLCSSPFDWLCTHDSYVSTPETAFDRHLQPSRSNSIRQAAGHQLLQQLLQNCSCARAASCFVFPLALGSASPAAVIIQLGLPAAFKIALDPQLSLPARLSSAQSLQYHLPLSCVPGLMPTHTCAQKIATASASCVTPNSCFTGSQHLLRGRPRWQPRYSHAPFCVHA